MIRLVNIVPQAQSNETSQDSEPNISVNPARPRQIAITAFTPDPLGGANAPIYVSTDGGANWALNTIVPSVAGSTTGTGDITLRFGGAPGEGWNLRPGDSFYPADIDNDGGDEVVVVSPDGLWIGVLDASGAGLSAGWLVRDWVNPPGGTGPSGWNLKQGDRFFVADIDGDDRDELIVVSPNGQWIGILRESGGGLEATWIKNDWVNHPGGSGANGWDLKQGDRFFVADIDADNRDELIVVSPNGEWIGILREDNGGLSAGWIKNDWVNHPGGSGASGWNLNQPDRFFVADIDGDNRHELIVVSGNGQWIGILREDNGGLSAGWIKNDWVNHPGGSGASGWDLRQGDRFFVADIDADNRDELVIVSPDTQWIGVLQEAGGGLEATWLGNDWVNHPGGSGASGWDLKLGDRFFVADVDANNHQELLVSSPNGRWLGLFRDSGGGLAATWITADWVEPTGGALGALLAGGILSASVRLRLQTLRTFDFANATPMPVLSSRDNVDQPYTETIRPGSGQAAGKDVLYIGINDFGGFGGTGGRTATIEACFDAGAPTPAFTSIRLERRTTSGQDGPPIRPAVHSDGTVYAVFSSWQTFSNVTGVGTADVVVVRDDDWGRSANPFSALVDPGDNVAGMRVTTGMNFTFNFMAGQERHSCPLSIAVDPRTSDTVWVAWGDLPGGVPTLHVNRSTDRGVTWSADLRAIANATNPALAVTDDGTVGFMFQQLTGTAPATRWNTHFQRTSDGTNWTDFMLATVPSNAPASAFLPYLGDYLGLKTHGVDFYGVFSTNNTPLATNFPQGVRFLRNADWTTNALRNAANTTNVAISIDPFFVKITPPPDGPDVRITCTDKASTPFGHGRIEALGGIENGVPWKLTVPQVIARIEEEDQRFFVEEPVGDRVGVVIATTSRGRRFVKTVADGDEPNNLIALPDCP